jgi:hypothetical protein
VTGHGIIKNLAEEKKNLLLSCCTSGYKILGSACRGEDVNNQHKMVLEAAIEKNDA